MADKIVSFETAGNHWFWRGSSPLDCQTGTVVTMPEDGLITSLEFKVAGLDYSDPVYGYQNESGYVRPAVWRESDGAILTKGDYTVLPPSAGGTQPWVTFDVPNIQVSAGTRLIVGFWRRSSSTAYSTQWDYNDDVAANGYVTLSQNIYDSSTGPERFVASKTYGDRSLNFRMHYVGGGRVKVWNGKQWVAKQAYVWNGTAWAKATFNVYDGVAWNESVE